MKRYFNSLPISIFLLIMWLLINDSVSPATLFSGVILALVLVWAASSLRPLQASPKHPIVMAKLFWAVVVDILASNLAVARLIVLSHRGAMSPGFLKIPLELRDPHGLAMLACIVTYVPGTVWVDYSQQDGVLTLHVLDLQNEAHWINIIKLRYERPLMEIFE